MKFVALQSPRTIWKVFVPVVFLTFVLAAAVFADSSDGWTFGTVRDGADALGDSSGGGLHSTYAVVSDTTNTLTSLSLYLASVGSGYTHGVEVLICASAGWYCAAPDRLAVGAADISPAAGGTYSWVKATFITPLSVTSGVTYYVQLTYDASSDASNYINVGLQAADVMRSPDFVPLVRLWAATPSVRNGLQTISASATAQFAATAVWLVAVRMDALSPHHEWMCSPTTGNCQTDNFTPQEFVNGRWRVTAFASESGTTTLTSAQTYIDVNLTGVDGINTFTAGALPLSEVQIGSFGYTVSSTDSAGFTFSASAAALIGQHLTIDSSGCAHTLDESSTSTLCKTSTWSDAFLNYPLVGWPAGIMNAIFASWSETKSASSAYSLTLNSHGAGIGYIPTLTVVDSASDGAGIGYWYSQTGSGPTAFRDVMALLIWVGWVLAMGRRANSLIS